MDSTLLLDTALTRDLLFISLICSAAAIAWAGWAQGAPPHRIGGLVLRICSWAGSLLAAVSLVLTVLEWNTGPTGEGISRSWTPVFIIAILTLYIGITGAVISKRVKTDWSGYATPWILLWFGVAIGALVWPTGQRFILVAGIALIASAVVAVVMQRRQERKGRSGGSRRALRAARTTVSSYWSGLLAAPILLVTAIAVLVTTLVDLYA